VSVAQAFSTWIHPLAVLAPAASLVATLTEPLVHGDTAHVYKLPADLLAKAQAMESARTALYFGGAAWTIGFTAILVRFRLGAHIARLADRSTRRRAGPLSRPWLAGLIAVPLWLLVLALIGLPVSLLSHRLSLAYKLSVEGWPGWWSDWARSTLLGVAVGTLVLSSLYALLRHTRRAWFWFWLLTLPCIVAGVFLTPLVVDPLFNHFSPLGDRNPALVAQLERVAARGGMTIPPSRMFVMDASRRYTGMNAYVTGFGASKRIVIWDTTLPTTPGTPKPSKPGTAMSIDELLDIYGHEQGHYVLGHIWKGMLYTAVLLFAFYWLAFRLIEAAIRRRGEAWQIAANPSDWSSLGLVLLVAGVLSFLADPLANGFSRMEEHQADVYGQEVIHGLVPDPQGIAVEDFNRLGRVWLEDPEPNRFVVWWTYSHPPTSDRANFAATYDPWRPGGRPRYFPH
jgi:Zn-dependent protease with chaperone function